MNWSVIMSNHEDKKYKKPPIVEAIVDIRIISNSPHGQLEIADDFSTRVREEFPKRSQINSATDGGSFAMAGVRFLDEDEFRAIDIYPSQFVYRVRKYTGWEVFEPEAKVNWSKYSSWQRDYQVSRVAIRYTNRFDIDVELAKKDELFYPSVSDTLGRNENLLTYALHTLVFQPDINATVSLMRGIVPPSQLDKVSVVLDVDIFREFDNEVVISTEDQSLLWDIINTLHVRGKEYFEGSITDAVREEIDK